MQDFVIDRKTRNPPEHISALICQQHVHVQDCLFPMFHLGSQRGGRGAVTQAAFAGLEERQTRSKSSAEQDGVD